MYFWNSLFFNIKTGGAGVTLVVEYWNGSTWVDISIGNAFYSDNTNNLTTSNSIVWDYISGWVKSYPEYHTEDGYFLYCVDPLSRIERLNQELYATNSLARLAAQEHYNNLVLNLFNLED